MVIKSTMAAEVIAIALMAMVTECACIIAYTLAVKEWEAYDYVEPQL